MNNQNTMAQQQAPPRQPQYFPRPPTADANGMSPPPYPPPQSPSLHYPPAQQQYSWPQYNQPPAPKRARLSPGPQSPYPSPNLPVMQSPSAGSPVNGMSVNGFTPGSRPPGSMGPPSRPADRTQEDRSFDDILAGTGINIEEEDRQLTTSDFYGPPTPGSSFQSPQASFGSFAGGSQDRLGSSSHRDSSAGTWPTNQSGLSNTPQYSAEELQRQREGQADWQAGRHAQHPLWQPFLYGETLHDKILKQSYNEHLKGPSDGIMKPARFAAPQATRIDGPDGASRIIDRGETILQTGNGDALRDLLNVVCLAAKQRLAGLVDLSARLSRERRQHSKGVVPAEWASMAAIATLSVAPEEGVTSPAASTSLKRTHSQANADATGPNDIVTGTHRIAGVFQKVMQAERAAEAARLAKRGKRNAAANPDAHPSADMSVGPETPGGTSQDSERKVTKKDRKLADMKFTEQQQHRSANETARMATQGVLGRLGGGKKKQYSWLSGGGSGAGSPMQTPTKTNTGSPSTSATGTPGNIGVPAVAKSKQFGQWDEDIDPGIQARDVLLVLENDGKAPRSYVRGYSKLES